MLSINLKNLKLICKEPVVLLSLSMGLLIACEPVGNVSQAVKVDSPKQTNRLCCINKSPNLQQAVNSGYEKNLVQSTKLV